MVSSSWRMLCCRNNWTCDIKPRGKQIQWPLMSGRPRLKIVVTWAKCRLNQYPVLSSCGRKLDMMVQVHD